MSGNMSDFIQGMPITELHVNLESKPEHELKFVLVRRNGLDLLYASEAEMRAAYDFDDLSSFLN